MLKYSKITERPNRKPDFEDDNMRGWKVLENEKEKWDNEEGFEIETGDKSKFKLIEFNLLKNKKDGNVLFAFKQKDMTILYYIPDKYFEEGNKLLEILMLQFSKIEFKNIVTMMQEAKKMNINTIKKEVIKKNGNKTD